MIPNCGVEDDATAAVDDDDGALNIKLGAEEETPPNLGAESSACFEPGFFSEQQTHFKSSSLLLTMQVGHDHFPPLLFFTTGGSPFVFSPLPLPATVSSDLGRPNDTRFLAWLGAEGGGAVPGLSAVQATHLVTSSLLRTIHVSHSHFLGLGAGGVLAGVDDFPKMSITLPFFRVVGGDGIPPNDDDAVAGVFCLSPAAEDGAVVLVSVDLPTSLVAIAGLLNKKLGISLVVAAVDFFTSFSTTADCGLVLGDEKLKLMILEVEDILLPVVGSPNIFFVVVSDWSSFDVFVNKEDLGGGAAGVDVEVGLQLN